MSTSREKTLALSSLALHASARRLCVDDAEVAQVLSQTMCAHVIETSDPTLGYEEKRALVHTLLGMSWDNTVKIVEANK